MSARNSERESGKRKAGFKQHVSGQKAAAVPGHATLAKARSLDVTGFVEARSFEINALQRSLDSAKAVGNARAFQTLPRHLRRRAASHNVKRVPVRLREKALSEMQKSAQSSKTLGGSGKLTNAKKNNRYKRRRARSVREEYELRQTGKRWLETHVWHAKRMHMRERWGAMVADSPNERSHRAAYRAAMEKTYAQDVSYYRTVEIAGQADAITRLVGCLVAPEELTIAAACYAGGSRMAPLTLYRAGQYPLAALGPASALWKPAAEGEPRVLWIRVHPCIADAMLAELASARASMPEPPVQQLRIDDISCDIVSFELLGNQSTQVLHAILSHAVAPDACGSSVLQAIRALPSPATLPESVVVALRIHDPRLRFPFKLEQEKEAAEGEARQLEELLRRWPAGAAALPGAGDDGIWDRASCARDVARRPSEASLNARRHAQLIPGAKLSPDPSVDVTMPLLLVRTGPEAVLGSRVARTGAQLVDNLAHGWTLMAPKGWGMPLWLALSFAGARAQGLQERHHVGFEAGLPTFPASWPGTGAYDSWAGALAAEEYARWSRRPPGKRANYLEMGVDSPFMSPFHRLLGLASEPGAYPEVTASDLQCRMARIRKISASKKAAALAIKGDGDVDVDVDMAESESESESATKPSASDATNSAGLWLACGERLSGVVCSLLAKRPASDGAVSLSEWAQPLVEAVRGPVREEDPLRVPSDQQLLERCLVRVRLHCSGRGVPVKNAPIYMRSATPPSSREAEPASVDPKGAATVGYVMTGSFSLARGCGMAIGACSLKGLFDIWNASVAAGRSASSPKSARVAINSMNGGPTIDAILSVIP